MRHFPLQGHIADIFVCFPYHGGGRQTGEVDFKGVYTRVKNSDIKIRLLKSSPKIHLAVL